MTNPAQGSGGLSSPLTPTGRKVSCQSRARPVEAFREQFQRFTLPRPGLARGPSGEPAQPKTAVQAGPDNCKVGRSAVCEENAFRGKETDRLASELPESRDEVERDRPAPGEGEASSSAEAVVWCDPLARALLQWAPPPVVASPPVAAAVPDVVLEHIAGQLVKRAAVGASAVHLQFGKGQLDGAELFVCSTADGLEIRLSAPSGVNGRQLGLAIAERLARRGLRVARVEVE